MYFFLIFISLTFSTVVARLVYKKKKTKMISIFSALVINSLILGISFSFLYLSNIEMWNAGMVDMGLLYLILAIPTITWFNALLLQFIKVTDTVING